MDAALSSPALQLGYLVFSARKPLAWRQFASRMLGLPAPRVHKDASLGFQLDAQAQRLVVTPGLDDDLAAIGLECADDEVLDTLLARLADAGIRAPRAQDALARMRCVRRLHRFDDPAGNTVELFVGPEAAERPFASAEVRGGFRTQDLGLGHVALVTRDPAALERFYVNLLGFGVTERIDARLGPVAMKGSFLHCNRRHHTLAAFDLPVRKRIHHFMLEVNEIADVGAAFERARKEVPLSLGLGQHPDPDGTFSFYGETPGGFDFEIGAGGKLIRPELWRPQRSAVTSAWGHKPRLRARVKMAMGLLARAF